MEHEQMDNGINNRGRVKRKKSGKRVVGLAAFLIFAAVFLVLAVGLVKKYMPTSEKMSGYDYFEIPKGSDEVFVILNEEQINNLGRYVDNRLYLFQEFVEDNVNIRFYYDKETNAVLYSDCDNIYTLYPDMTGYKDMDGNAYDTDFDIVKNIEGSYYIDFEFVAQRSHVRYEYGFEPARLVLYTHFDTAQYVTANKALKVRYRAGIKSKVLEKLEKDEVLKYEGDVDEDWICVRTASGYRGYVKKADVSAVYENTPVDSYKEEYTSNLLDKKINMAWFQVTQKAANANIDNYIQNVKDINVLSPTWYSIASEDGDINSLATQTLVDNMHKRGIEVWPLVNDFDKNIDFEALYSSRQARTKLINNLIREASVYGYEGYNIDFEYVKKDFAQDYLQFLRELSIACDKKNLVLSVDNYKPASHNAHYRLDEQAIFVDYIVIMGYDEHYAGSEAGSVASLPFVEEGISRATDMVPSQQVINAVPFFTRIWTENAGKTTSRAVGIQAALDNMTSNNAVAVWDEALGQYYCSYETSAGTVKIWLEEDRSLGEKMKLYSKYNLAGVAEWKLGLETDSVWDIISKGLEY